MTQESLFLFSVDVEDFPVIKDGKEGWAGSLDLLLERYMAFLRKREMKGTFFVLGEVAEKYPDIIRRLSSEGHEIGCHGHVHIPLTKHTLVSLEEDLEKSLNTLAKCGAKNVKGYRAPFLSMIPETSWAYESLKKFNFEYSSSVLPRFNPLFSWPSFGTEPKKQNGIWELPITVMPGLPVGVPAAAGVYFRVMPNWMVQKMMKGFADSRTPVLSYFHPYDIDFESESRKCTWLKNNPVGNYFIFYNRKKLLKRLDRVMENNFKIITYSEYLKNAVI